GKLRTGHDSVAKIPRAGRGKWGTVPGRIYRAESNDGHRQHNDGNLLPEKRVDFMYGLPRRREAKRIRFRVVLAIACIRPIGSIEFPHIMLFRGLDMRSWPRMAGQTEIG